MPRPRLVVAIKAIHTAIFALMLSAIGWLVLTGFTGRRDRTVAAAAALVCVEVAVFLANDRVCPMTPLAEKYGAADGSVTDIFLPDALARTTPIWSTALLVLAGLLHVRSAVRAR